MEKKINIRQAEEKDVEIVLSLIKELAEYEKLSDKVKATTDDLRKAIFGERKFAEVLIGEVDDLPVGMALYFYNFSTFVGKPGLYLEDIYVKPEYRGLGLGKMLFKELIKTAKLNNCGRMEWSVLDWNKPAIDFYLSLGAEPMDEWTVYRISL